MTMTTTTASASASVVGASRRAMGGKSVRASMVASIGGARRERVATYAGKGRGAGRRGGPSSQMQQQVEQFMPPIDPDNEQFVIYVRSKRGIKAYIRQRRHRWKRGEHVGEGLGQLHFQEMAQKSLAQNIVKAIHQDMDAIEKVARSMPMLKQAKEIEYGFGVLDKENPRSMFSPSADKVWLIPSEEECETPADKMSQAADNLKKMFGQ